MSTSMIKEKKAYPVNDRLFFLLNLSDSYIIYQARKSGLKK